MRDPCKECGAPWYGRHESGCKGAAADFVKRLNADGRATADEDPRCPKCGMAETNWTDFLSGHRGAVGDGDKVSFICGYCDHDYYAELVVRYSFRVAPVDVDGVTSG